MISTPYRVLNEILVDKQALIHNFNFFKSKNIDVSIAPVLKSNAYGHGLNLVASLIDDSISAPFVCVDSMYEAYELQKAHFKTPILILGYTFPDNYKRWKKLPFIFSVSDLETIKSLNKYQPGAKIHLKIDTGMCRLGFQKNQIQSVIEALKMCPNVSVDGIYSHLSQADDVLKTTFTNRQITLFKQMVTEFETAGFTFKWKHIAATAGGSIKHDPYFNLIRLGIGFYGISPFGPHTTIGREQRLKLKPALSLKTHIAATKIVMPGNVVSYGGTYRVKHQTTIAILPIGYNEGLNRQLSNKGSVNLENNTICPIIGNICMNMCMIKLPKDCPMKSGDGVTVISPDTAAQNSIYHISQLLNTIPYTILTGLHPSIRRSLI